MARWLRLNKAWALIALVEGLALGWVMGADLVELANLLSMLAHALAIWLPRLAALILAIKLVPWMVVAFRHMREQSLRKKLRQRVQATMELATATPEVFPCQELPPFGGGIGDDVRVE